MLFEIKYALNLSFLSDLFRNSEVSKKNNNLAPPINGQKGDVQALI
jgi:hypothetical protein